MLAVVGVGCGRPAASGSGVAATSSTATGPTESTASEDLYAADPFAQLDCERRAIVTVDYGLEAGDAGRSLPSTPDGALEEFRAARRRAADAGDPREIRSSVPPGSEPVPLRYQLVGSPPRERFVGRDGQGRVMGIVIVTPLDRSGWVVDAYGYCGEHWARGGTW